jgi:hypothetical protein
MYAHAVIVDPRTDRRFERGDVVPAGIPGEEELIDAGSLSDEPYTEPDPAKPDIRVVMTSSDVEGLTKSTREELERRGLLADAAPNGSDGATSGEAQA